MLGTSRPPNINRRSAFLFRQPSLVAPARLGSHAVQNPAEWEHLLLNSFQLEEAILDPRGQVIAATDAWRAKAAESTRSGESCNEINSHSPLDFLTSDPVSAAQISRDLYAVLSGKRDEVSRSISVTTPKGLRHSCLHIGAIEVGRLRCAAVLNEDVTEIADLTRDKRLLALQLVQSEDKERRRIAREMHDSTLQDLVAIGLMLRRLHYLEGDKVAQDVLNEVRSVLSRTQREVRTLSYLLHPPLLEEGGLPLALSSLIRGLASRMDAHVDFVCNCGTEEFRFPMEVEVALYRVAQEALINVQKHASATKARVRLSKEAGDLVLTIEDNGLGIGGRNGGHVGSGVGIDGMRSRLAQLGGKLTLSNLSEGTRIRAEVPIDCAAGLA